MATPDYWADQILQPVRFEEAVRGMLASGPTICLELGPHSMLSALGRSQDDPARGTRWIPSLRRRRDDLTTLLDALRELELAVGR